MSVRPLTPADRVCETCGCRLSLYAPESKRFCSTHEPADALNVRELGVLANELGLEPVDLTPPELRPDPTLYCSKGHERAVYERVYGKQRKRQCTACKDERDRKRHLRGRVRDRSGERKRVTA